MRQTWQNNGNFKLKVKYIKTKKQTLKQKQTKRKTPRVELQS
jgi:phosphate-selective porin